MVMRSTLVKTCCQSPVWSSLRRQHMSSFAPAPPHTPADIRHLLSIADLSTDELQSLVTRAREIKSIVKNGTSGNPGHSLLKHKTIAMMFKKRSTRTRVSTESAVAHLGGSPMFLGKDDIQLNVNESLYDTSRVISSMVSAMVVRCGPHSDVTELARYSAVPVINALSDTFHPCQAVTDLMTIQEVYGERHVKVAWVGDANNVLYDLLFACAKVGYDVSIATPSARPMPMEILEPAREYADVHDAKILLTTDPGEAVKDANVIVTDTWISMGEEAQREEKMKMFKGYQVTSSMMASAAKGCHFMHCLPRHPEEVSDEVFYSDQSVVFQEAENRKWAMIAILEWLCSQKY